MKFTRRNFITTSLISAITIACSQNTQNNQNNQSDKNGLDHLNLSTVPTRIIALDWTDVENLLALGIQPVGIADINGYKKYINIDLKLDNSVVDLGTRSEPNLEKITELKPDLILGTELRHKTIYSNLSAISPTVIVNTYPQTGSRFEKMTQHFLNLAKILNREEQGKKVLDEMNTKFQTAKEKIANAKITEKPIILARFSGSSQYLRLFTNNSPAMEVCNQIGLKNAWSGVEEFGFSTVGMESLIKIQDANFIYINPPGNTYLAKFQKNPVWQNLNFVKEKRIYPLQPTTWVFGGPISMQLFVDEIVAVST